MGKTMEVTLANTLVMAHLARSHVMDMNVDQKEGQRAVVQDVENIQS